MDKPVEAADIPAHAIKITPIMLTHIKDAGTPNAKYKGRFVADGRRVPRYKQFAPPMALNMKRTADINGLIESTDDRAHGVIVADMTNGYLNAEFDPTIEIYMQVPRECQTEKMKKMETEILMKHLKNGKTIKKTDQRRSTLLWTGITFRLT